MLGHSAQAAPRPPAPPPGGGPAPPPGLAAILAAAPGAGRAVPGRGRYVGRGARAMREWGGAALARGDGIHAGREPPVPGPSRAGWPEWGRGDILASGGSGGCPANRRPSVFPVSVDRCPFKYKIVAVFE